MNFRSTGTDEGERGQRRTEPNRNEKNRTNRKPDGPETGRAGETDFLKLACAKGLQKLVTLLRKGCKWVSALVRFTKGGGALVTFIQGLGGLVRVTKIKNVNFTNPVVTSYNLIHFSCFF